jgi:polar amino acid transport system substrate-binding protein
MEWQTFLKWFFAFCHVHPIWAVAACASTVATLLIGLGTSLEKVLGWLRPVSGGQGPTARRVRMLIYVMLGVVSAGCIAMVVLVRRYDQPRPVITEPPASRLLSQWPVVRWSYAGAQTSTRYRLAITDRETGKHQHICTHQLSHDLRMSGRLSIKVAAYTDMPKNRDCLCENVAVDAESDEMPLEIFPDSVARIKHLKVLMYAVHHDAQDGMFCYEQNGEYVGFDQELVALIAAELQKQYGLDRLGLVPYESSWNDIFGAPDKWQVDLAIASISITPARAQEHLFSEPYWTSTLALIVKRPSGEKAPTIDYSLQQLANLKIGFHKGTTAADFTAVLGRSVQGVTFKAAEDNDRLFAMLGSAEIDGALYDLDRSWSEAPVGSPWIPARLDLKGLDYAPEQYGIMFASINKQLKEDVDRALRAIGPAKIKELINRRLRALPGMTDVKFY